MQLNAMFPTRDIGSDPARIREWAQAAENLGYAYIEVPDHVFGATARDGWTPRYNERDPFHETFVKLAMLREEINNLGRDPAKFGLEGWLRMHDADPQQWAEGAEGWRRLGADFVILYPMYRMPKFEDQIETLRWFKEVAGG